MKLRYLSLFSGIEAASKAWETLGWEPTAFAETAPFPSAVLAARYPGVPNLGNVLEPDFVGRALKRGQPDVIVGGSPCQAFSVAGLRKGLTDARGNLTLRFVEICDAIDPPLVLWENVPGVLSDRTNALGSLIAGLAGLDAAPVPVGGRWPRAGRVDGRRRRVAWCVLDAQFFGVPQRRRRVFLLAVPRHARLGAGGRELDPSEILALGQGLRGNTPTRGEAGERVAPSLAARTRGGGGLGTDAEVDGALVAHSLRADGFDASEDGTGRGTPLVPVAMARESGQGWWTEDEVAGTLDRNMGASGHANRAAVLAFDTTQITHPENRCQPQPGAPCHPLAAGAHPPAIAFSSKDYGADAGPLSPTLRAAGHGRSHANAGSPPAVAFHLTQDPISGDPTPALSSGNGEGCATLGVAVPVSEVGAKTRTGDGKNGCGIGDAGDPMFTLQAEHGHGVYQCHGTNVGEMGTMRKGNGNVTGGVPFMPTQHGVRRLTPTECERLQGFPDGWTAIIYRGKPAADGPRYKALGNSMAVPVIRWIGHRIAMAFKRERRKLPQDMSAGQCGPKLDLERDELNEKERAVLARFARAGSERTLTELAATFAPDPRGNSWARNSLRRLIRGGFLTRVSPGRYRKT